MEPTTFSKTDKPRLWTNDELEDFITNNSNLIRSMVKSYIGCIEGYTAEDLYQEGCCTVIEKIHNWDPRRSKATSYAGMLVKTAMNKLIRDQDAKKRGGDKLPTLSLDNIIGDEDSVKTGHEIALDTSGLLSETLSPEEAVEKAELVAAIRTAIETALTPEESYTVKRIAYDMLSQTDVAAHFDVSQSKISSIYSLACEKIRLELNKLGFNDFGDRVKKVRTRRPNKSAKEKLSKDASTEPSCEKSDK